jgi:hypothetical protein
MSAEQLLLLLVFVGVPLLERVIRRIRARAAESTAADVRSTSPERTVPAARAPVPAPDEGRLVPEPRQTDRPRRVRTAGARVTGATAADLRRAVVLMTILGPCRALDRTAGP